MRDESHVLRQLVITTKNRQGGGEMQNKTFMSIYIYTTRLGLAVSKAAMVGSSPWVGSATATDSSSAICSASPLPVDPVVANPAW